MSDLAPIIKDGAEDMAGAGEKAGGAIAKHFTDIGGELKNAGTRYRSVESDVEKSMTGSMEGDVQGAERAAGAVGKDAAQTVDTTAKDVGAQSASETRKLASDSEEESEFSGREQGSGGSTDDPIDLVTGEMYLPQEDLRLEGIVPLVIERRHGSFYRRGRWFGRSWASTFDQRVEVDDDGIHYAAPDGRVLHYPVPTVHGQRVLPSHGPRWPLTWNRDGHAEGPSALASKATDGVIEIEQGDLGLVLQFRPAASSAESRPLSSVVDRGGNRITFACDADGVPTDVYHSGGYHVLVESIETRGGVRVGGLKLADPAGGSDVRIRTYRYDMAGRLITVVNALGHEQSFEYDREDRVTRWLDANGYDYRYEYREDGRVVRGEGSEGSLAVTLDYDLEARITTKTDALGHAEKYHWNERLQTVKVVDALGNATVTAHSRYGEVIEVTDPLGRTTAVERDAFGDPTAIRRPDGTVFATSYDAQRRPVTLTDANGAFWRYEYDPGSGQLAKIIDPTGAVTAYAGDEQGRITAIVDPLGRSMQVVSDRAGLPIALTDASGDTHTYQRDAFGRVVAAVDSTGGTVRIEWDPEGRPLRRTLADGTVERWSYDAEGNLVEHVDFKGASTRYEYGPFDAVTSRVDAAGTVFGFEYDPQLRLRTVLGPDEARWVYEHDPVGRVIAEKDFNGASMAYTFDAAGQLTLRTNALGQELRLEYDVMGRVSTRSLADETYQYTYDGSGRLIDAGGAGGSAGARVQQSYDPLGRVLSEGIGERAVTSVYDPAGQRVSRTTPSGVTTQWSYSPAGRPTQMSGSHGALAFEHDALGRETNRQIGPSAAITTAYDAVGRVTGQALWVSDQTGTPDGWHAATGRTYTYGGDVTPVIVDDRLRGARSYRLDPLGRAVEVGGADWRETYAYDALGNLALAEAGDPAASPTAVAVAETAGARQIRGTTVQVAGRTRYTYDAAGRLVRRTRRTLSGTELDWHFTWDAENHLTEVAAPGGDRWRYTYDALGRRVGKQHTNAAGEALESIEFSWDGPRLAEQRETSADGTVSVLTWDYLPGRYIPAAQTRRTWATDAPQPEIDAAFHAIVADLVGTPMELVDAGGTVVWRAETTLWGAALADHGACPLGFPGQYRDEESGLHYNLNRYYDPDTAAYATPDPLGLWPAPNPHRYVDNPLSWIDPLGLAAYKVVNENDAGRFGDLNPGTPGDNLTPHHMPQAAAGYTSRDDGGAVVMSHDDHVLTRTYGSKGRVTKAAEAGLPFKTVLDRDIADMRRIGQIQHGDPTYFDAGITKLEAYYKSIGKI